MSSKSSKKVVTATVQKVELPEREASSGGEDLIVGNNIDLVGEVKVKLSALIGHSEMTISDLFNLRSDSLIKLDRATDAPIDILLDEKIVARGELVVVDENFGVRITEIMEGR